MIQDEIAALIPANVGEEAVRAMCETRLCNAECLATYKQEGPCDCITEARASLAAGLAAWGGMYVEPETMYGKEIGKTIFLPIEEPTP